MGKVIHGDRPAEETLWAKRQNVLARYWQTMVLSARLTRQIEGCIHELCHAAVLAISFNDYKVADTVATWFTRQRNRLVADRSECRALAVEMLVVRALMAPIDMDVVCRVAASDMRTLDAQDTQDLVRAFMPLPTTRRRAAKVVRALRKVWKDAEVD